jgi:hypothetical protein
LPDSLPVVEMGHGLLTESEMNGVVSEPVVKVIGALDVVQGLLGPKLRDLLRGTNLDEAVELGELLGYKKVDEALVAIRALDIGDFKDVLSENETFFFLIQFWQ